MFDLSESTSMRGGSNICPVLCKNTLSGEKAADSSITAEKHGEKNKMSQAAKQSNAERRKVTIVKKESPDRRKAETLK